MSSSTPKGRPPPRRRPPQRLQEGRGPLNLNADHGDLVAAAQQHTASLSSTWVPEQPRHRARRGRNHRSPHEQRRTHPPCVPPTDPAPADTTDTPTTRPPSQPRPRLLGTYDQHSGCRLPASRERFPNRPSSGEGSRVSMNARSLPRPPTSSRRATARPPAPVPDSSGAQQTAEIARADGAMKSGCGRIVRHVFYD